MLSGLRILAVDDNPMNRLMLSTLLGSVGASVNCVADGVEAVAAWERDPWDLILMDIQMPGLAGPDASRRIRSLEAASGRSRTPIVALTADTAPKSQDECMAAGMDLVAFKPLEFEGLVLAIQAGLDLQDDLTPDIQAAA